VRVWWNALPLVKVTPYHFVKAGHCIIQAHFVWPFQVSQFVLKRRRKIVLGDHALGPSLSKDSLHNDFTLGLLSAFTGFLDRQNFIHYDYDSAHLQ
jgi:hypothetical protein